MASLRSWASQCSVPLLLRQEMVAGVVAGVVVGVVAWVAAGGIDCVDVRVVDSEVKGLGLVLAKVRVVLLGNLPREIADGQLDVPRLRLLEVVDR